MVAIHRDLVEAIDAGEGSALDAAIEAHRPRAAPVRLASRRMPNSASG
jgi:DNA-binding FadR family transcriptional regulator